VGKFDFEADPNFLKQLGRLADVEKFAAQMIAESIQILEKNVRSEVGKHKRTGNMAKSIKRTIPKKNKKGVWYAVVRPTGTTTTYMNAKGKTFKRKKPYRNMAILAHLEYGTSKQAPIPILSKAINDSKAPIEAKMREVFEREIKK